MKKNNKSSFKKDIFLTGEYLKYFKPDEPKNPFSNIYYQKKKDTIETIKKLNNCKNILDIGGGMGRLSITLAKFKKYRTILSDISVDMLKLAIINAKTATDIHFVNTDAHQLPYRDKAFDLIIGLDLICHLRNPEIVLNEFNRVLIDEGILILDSTNSNPIWTLFYPRYMGKNPINWFKTIMFRGVFPGWEKIVTHYPKKTFISFLKNAGFEINRTINYGPAICPKWHLAISKKVA